MLYLSPAEDPEDMPETEGEYVLPTRENDEYKGFSRKIHEMELWKNMAGAAAVVDILSLFECTDM